MSWQHLLLASLFLIGTACARSPAEPAAAPAPVTSDAARIDTTHDGLYKSGRWALQITIVAPGSKSEGVRGELRFDDQPVPLAVVGDYYTTPWGPVQWVGEPEVLWGEHGWLPRDAQASGGRALPDPSTTRAPIEPTQACSQDSECLAVTDCCPSCCGTTTAMNAEGQRQRDATCALVRCASLDPATCAAISCLAPETTAICADGRCVLGVR